MKTGRVFLAVLCLLLSFPAFARQITVTGEIKDAADGSGIPFAAVHIKGTNASVISKNAKIGPLVDAFGAMTYGGTKPPAKVQTASASVKSNSISLT